MPTVLTSSESENIGLCCSLSDAGSAGSPSALATRSTLFIRRLVYVDRVV